MPPRGFWRRSVRPSGLRVVPARLNWIAEEEMRQEGFAERKREERTVGNCLLRVDESGHVVASDEGVCDDVLRETQVSLRSFEKSPQKDSRCRCLGPS